MRRHWSPWPDSADIVSRPGLASFHGLGKAQEVKEGKGLKAGPAELL